MPRARMTSASGARNVLDVGLLAAIALLIGVIAMLIVGRHSDLTLERRWPVACALFTAAVALIGLSMAVGSRYVTILLITVMTAGHHCGPRVFWSVPSVYLSDRAKAGGIAAVTAIGSMAAPLTPAVLGWIGTHTGDLSLGL